MSAGRGNSLHSRACRLERDAELVEAAFTPSPITHYPRPFIVFCSPLEGPPFVVPLMEGGRGRKFPFETLLFLVVIFSAKGGIKYQPYNK